jgi:hypothetical protein
VGDVINESREECGDPWAWGSTETSHQCIASDGEVARCGGELLLITLYARPEKRGGGATGPTRRSAAANLSCGIPWVTSGGGSHDAQRCPIKVAALSLTLRNRDGTVEITNLLNGRNCCARSAPRFQERCDIVAVGDRLKELTHAPQGVWRIGERVAADRLDACANLRAPLSSKCGCNGGEDAEICSKLQGTCRVRSGKNPLNLCTDSFTREARSEWGVAPDRCGSSWLHRQVEACNKSNCAQHAQRIFNKAFGWISNGAQQTVGQIVDATVRVNDRPISNRVDAATCTRGETVGDCVDGEVSTCEVALDAWEEGHLIWTAGVTTTAVSPEGGDLTHHCVSRRNTNGAEAILIGGVWKECAQLVWRRLGGEVPICRHAPSDHIANSTTYNIGAKACRAQRAQEISNIARDGGANRRRGGHAPLAAALSEMKRKSRHAE